MNKSLSFVNSSLELHVFSTFWLGSETSGTFSLHFTQPSHELERPALEDAHTLLQNWHLCCKFSAMVSLMLENPFLVPPLSKLNHISLCFIQISTKSPANCLFPSRKAMIFLKSFLVFWAAGKHNIKISYKTARVSRLSVSYENDYNQRSISLLLALCNFQPVCTGNVQYLQ